MTNGVMAELNMTGKSKTTGGKTKTAFGKTAVCQAIISNVEIYNFF